MPATASCHSTRPGPRDADTGPDWSPHRDGGRVQAPQDAAPALGSAPTGQTARVVRVIDGDTLIVDLGQGEGRVRVLGSTRPRSAARLGPMNAARTRPAAVMLSWLPWCKTATASIGSSAMSRSTTSTPANSSWPRDGRSPPGCRDRRRTLIVSTATSAWRRSLARRLEAGGAVVGGEFFTVSIRGLGLCSSHHPVADLGHQGPSRGLEPVCTRPCGGRDS